MRPEIFCFNLPVCDLLARGGRIMAREDESSEDDDVCAELHRRHPSAG